MRQFYQKCFRLFAVLTLLFGLLSGRATAQVPEVKVAGTVRDKAGLPLISVSVVIKGTTKGTVTDVNGKFAITVPNSSTMLTFSYVGYVSQDVAAGSGTPLSITLNDDAKSLNEVVVVGYGTQKRKDITGAVVSVDPKRLDNLPNTNIAQALEGAVPGLSINQNSGGAEGNDQSIIVRGRRSITASNSPLIILDGIPYNGSISDISPDDIGSIDVLKDASAAAIYGSRGANGVILITTKKGSFDGKPVIAYNGSYGIQKLGKLPQIFTPQEFYTFKNARYPGIMTASEQAVYDSGNFPNYLAMGTQTGGRDNQTISVRGGGNNSRYFVSAGYLDTRGIVVNDIFKRLGTRANVDVDVTKWLTFGTSTQLTYDDRSGLSPTLTGDGSIYNFNPLTTAYQADGQTLTVYPWPEKNAWANPLSPTLANNSDHTYSLFATNYAVVKLPLKGLQYRINTGVRYSSRNNYTYYGRNSKRGLEALGELNKADDLGTDYTIENILDYNRTFGKHNIAFTGLYSYESNVASGNTLNAQGFPNDVLTYYQANQALLVTPSSTYSKRALVSQMGRLNYSYNSKYLLTLTARRDGASPFGEDRKYSFFPSAALGWNVSSEPFMQNVKAISNLKLRLSYGSNGNQAVSPYSTLAGLANMPYINGTTTAAGYIPNKLGDASLHWETTNSFNAGIDFGLYNGRINGSIDFYSSKTHDLLLQRSISSVNGITSIVQNIGKTANKGIDIGINSVNIKSKDFNWSSNLTFTINRNKIVDLYGNGKNDTLNNWFLGHPIVNNFGYKYGGVWQTTDDLTKSPQANTLAGYAKVVDVNGDGKITPSDRTLLPDVQPSFTYGLGNTFSFRQWSLYVYVTGVQGVTKDNGTLVDNVNTEVEKNTYVKNYWTPTNPTNDYYANALQPNYLPNIYGVHIFQNASYLRVRDLLLSYSFPKAKLGKIGLTNLKVFAEGRNLFTVTPWKGYDPELSDQTGGAPLQKEFVFGINVSL